MMKKKVRFTDGVKTEFPDFKPRYSQTVNEGGNRNSDSSYGKNSGSDKSYGGARTQEVYDQGGPRSGGAYGV